MDPFQQDLYDFQEQWANLPSSCITPLDEIFMVSRNPSTKNLSFAEMDKASIVRDAMGYIVDLRKQVESMQLEIDDFQKSIADQTSQENEKSVVREKKKIDPKILEVNVWEIEERTYHIQIYGKNQRGVAAGLHKALECLPLEILNAKLTCFEDYFVNVLIVKVLLVFLLSPP
eukprot:Gb_36380 [translate_table: standard]